MNRLMALLLLAVLGVSACGSASPLDLADDSSQRLVPAESCDPDASPC